MDPAGPVARNIVEVWLVLLGGAVGIFGMVMILLGLALRPVAGSGSGVGALAFR